MPCLGDPGGHQPRERHAVGSRGLLGDDEGPDPQCAGDWEALGPQLDAAKQVEWDEVLWDDDNDQADLLDEEGGKTHDRELEQDGGSGQGGKISTNLRKPNINSINKTLSRPIVCN